MFASCEEIAWSRKTSLKINIIKHIKQKSSFTIGQNVLLLFHLSTKNWYGTTWVTVVIEHL